MPVHTCYDAGVCVHVVHEIVHVLYMFACTNSCTNHVNMFTL